MGTVRRRGRWWALGAGGIGFATTFLYIGVIISEGDNEWVPVTLFALVMASASTAALAAEVVPTVEAGLRLLVVSTVMFAAVGMLGIFTIGLPFLVAAGLAAVGVLVAAGLAAVGAIRLGDRPEVA